MMWYAVGVLAAILFVMAVFLVVAALGPLAGLVVAGMALWLITSAYRWLMRRVGADVYEIERRSLTK